MRISTFRFFAAALCNALPAMVQGAVVTEAAPAQTHTAVSATLSPTPTTMGEVKKRCNPNESCPDITAGPEVPIAVTTTMM
jgi:hypothetical protein